MDTTINKTVTSSGVASFNTEAQSALMKQLGGLLINAVKQPDAVDERSIFDAVGNSLSESGTVQEYIDVIMALKNDEEIQQALTQFQQGLEGIRDISETGTAALAANGASGPTFDAGLNGDVLLGDDEDLIRYSDYISGAGSSIGGFVPGIPGTVIGLSKNINSLRLRDVLRLEKKLGRDVKRWARAVDDNLRTGYQDQLGVWRRDRKAVVIDASDLGYGKHVKADLSAKDRALLQVFDTGTELDQARVKAKAAAKTDKLLGKVGKGVKVVGSGFSIAQGSVSVAAGREKLSDAYERYEKGEISLEEYNTVATKARLRIASGSLGIGKGVVNIGELIAVKVAKNIGEEASKKASRFAPVVGNVIGLGLGALSVTKNAMAADEARLSGNHGRAAMFGVMAALDSVTLVLDAVSLALDFIPGIGTLASFVVDLFSTVIGFFSDLIGFFTELVDTRTPEEKLKAEFDKYISSDQFKKYIDKVADNYKEQGYDILRYHIDAESANIEVDSVENSEQLRKKIESRTIIRELTEKAKQNTQNLRLAILEDRFGDNKLKAGPGDDLIQVVDKSVGNKILLGLAGDDTLIAGQGNDLLEGGEGDDILFGGAGSDALYGGAGNDFINGGIGDDTLFGGDGDDVLTVDPYRDWEADGGPGVNTLVINPAFSRTDRDIRGVVPQLTSLNSDRGEKNDIPLGYNYINLDTNQTQFGLDKLFEFNVEKLEDIWVKTNNLIEPNGHQGISDAFLQWSKVIGRTFANESERSQAIQSEIERAYGESNLLAGVDAIDELNGKTLWFLSRNASGRTHFTDGEHLYYVGSNNHDTLFKSNNTISGFANYIDKDLSQHYERLSEIDPRFVNLNNYTGGEFLAENTRAVKGVFDSSYYLESWLYGAFKIVTDIRNVTNISSNQRLTPYITGDDQDNVIKIGYRAGQGHAFGAYGEGYVRSGAGNDTIILEQNNASNSFKHFNLPDVDGGEGFDTVILTTKADAQERYGLSDDYRFRLTDKKGASGYSAEGYLVKNVESVILSGNGAGDGKPVFLDTDVANAVAITVNSSPTVNVTTSAQNDTVRIIDAGKGSTFTNRGGVDTIEFKFQQFENLQVDLDTGQVSGAFDLTLFGFDNANAGFASDQLFGNRNSNLLVARYSNDTALGREGDDHLVSQRGQHTLIGGEGRDTYTVGGFRQADRLAITVSRDGNLNLSASAFNSVWDGERLVSHVLSAYEKTHGMTVDLSSLRVVNSQGQDLTSKGVVSLGENTTIVFDLNKDFAHLGRNRKETIFIEFETTGSLAIIEEEDSGNALRLLGVKSIEELSLDFDSEFNLIVRGKGKNALFTDKTWGKKFNSGQSNLLALAQDFSQRFSRIMLPNAGISLSQVQVYEWLSTLLKPYYLYDESTRYVLSDSSIRQPVGFNRDMLLNHDESWTDNTYGGDDFVIANKYGNAVNGLDTGEGNDTIIATVGVQRGIGKESSILPGGGNDTVFIGNKDRTVSILFDDSSDIDTLVIKNWPIDQVDIVQQKESIQVRVEGDVLSKWYGKPDVIAFQGADQTVIVNDVDGFLKARLNNQAYQPRHFLNQNEQAGLLLSDVSSDQVAIQLAQTENGKLSLRFKKGSETLYEMASEMSPVNSGYSIKNLSQVLALNTPGGIQFANQTIEFEDLDNWFEDIFNESSRSNVNDIVNNPAKPKAYAEGLQNSQHLSRISEAMAGFGINDSAYLKEKISVDMVQASPVLAPAY